MHICVSVICEQEIDSEVDVLAKITIWCFRIEKLLCSHIFCMKITVGSDLLATKRRSRYTSGSSAGANWGMRRLLYRAWGHRWRYDKLMAPEDSDQPREKCKTFQRYIRLKDTARLWNYLFILRYLWLTGKALQRICRE